MAAEESFRPNIKASKRTCITVNRCILMVRTYKVNGRIVHKTYQLIYPTKIFIEGELVKSNCMCNYNC